MTSMFFLVLIIGVFLLTFVSETESLSGFTRKPAGLLRWLTSGNWPAKIGAGLMIIGFGALLRYLMLNIDLPIQYKIIMGITCSFILGVMSVCLRNRPERRAIHLALGGAALGVAYLTAYSEHAYFGYYNNVQSLGLLFLVAGAATAFAIASGAMSVAILAMFGAYFAPAFGYYNTEIVGIADVIDVYSYYILVSLLCLLMIYMRGWRPLIHLSFLFSLAGGLFFFWILSYCSAECHDAIQPLLLALIAIHLAMPILEKQKSRTKWIDYFDNWYFFLLPIISLVLILSISPNIYQNAWRDVLALFGLWFAASIFQYFVHREQALRYASIALILFTIAVLISLPEQPFYLICLVLSSIIYRLLPTLKAPDLIKNIGALLILFFFACYVTWIPWSKTASPFLNMMFFENLLVALLLALVGTTKCKNEVFEYVFKVTACLWFIYLLYFEILNLHLQHLPQIFYISIMASSFIYALWLIKNPESPLITALMSTLIIITGLYAARLTWSESSLWIIILSGQIIFSLIAFFSDKQANDDEKNAGITRSLLPIILFPWAFAVAKTIDGPENYIAACFIVGSALFASAQSQFFCPKGRFWPNTLSPVGLVIFGAGLLYTTLFHIQHGPWPMFLDVLLMIYLFISCRWMAINKNKDASFFVLFCLIAAIAFIQSLFLRFFGPANQPYMTVRDLWTMDFPAMVSLSWVIIGDLLCVFSNRMQSRFLWSSGALLLGIATLKLVIFDFGSLDQIGNIIAMILSGAVFMGLAWFVPIPPKVKKFAVKKEANCASIKRSTRVTGQSDGSSSQRIWIISTIIILFLIYNSSSQRNSYEYQSSSNSYANLSLLVGNWEHNHKQTSVEIWDDKQVVFCNEQGDCARGVSRSVGVFFVPQWDVTGSVSDDKNMILWSNGTIWKRNTRPPGSSH